MLATMKIEEFPAIWYQAANCGGCSISIFNSVSPGIENILIDEIIPGKHINLRFHTTIMAAEGNAAIRLLENSKKANKDNYILIVEGAIPTAKNGTYGTTVNKDGKRVPMATQLQSLAQDASVIIALGTCAAFGGIAAAQPNPTGCMGVDQFLNARRLTTPLINVPGCPPHPDWFTGTIASLLLYGPPKPEELDEYKRPKAFYGKPIHENCPRRAYFEEGKFATSCGELGCLSELGCKGPVTYADCPLRKWNNGINWCIGAGSPCIGCCEPGFPDLVSPFYQKLNATSLPL